MMGKDRKLAKDRRHLLSNVNSLGENWPVVKEKWLGQSGVSHVSAAKNPPFKPITTSISERYEGGSPQGENLSYFMADFDYFNLFNVELIAGRSFSKILAATSKYNPWIETHILRPLWSSTLPW